MEIYSNNFNGLCIVDKEPIIIYSMLGRRNITYVKNLLFYYSKYEILKHLRKLKKELNCNGTFKNNELLFLGEHKNKIYNYFNLLGHKVVIVP